MFTKVLIANRGEIALRALRTCKELGIKAVAVYSDADKQSLPVQYSDEAVNIGVSLARKSYLNIAAIIEAAKKTQSEAIYPGYGFLAENASFAWACAESGIKFIGPSPEAQRLAGEKIESRRLAAKIGVPIVPGSDGSVSVEEAVAIAKHVGYPVIVKASGGGGGRGIRVAYTEEELTNLVPLARGEAKAAFGNPDIYLEKYLEQPRHVEFQILADEFGNYVHLGERECSIQMRHQKLIEESPSPFVGEGLRKRMSEAAIAVMRSVGYVNAGTVEFLVDREETFYFNEINSRLQVEHPTTEMVTGVDLVHQQFLIADGNRLSLKQEDIHQFGWSIECRINAQDADAGFAPSPGVIEKIILPGGPGVRVDTHLYGGYEVPPFYDSLVGKLVVWAEDRNAAIRRMRRALGEFCIEGIKTTIPFHQRVMVDEDFVGGKINTQFLRQKAWAGLSTGA